MPTWHSATTTTSPNEVSVTTPAEQSASSALVDPMSSTAPMPTAKTVRLRTNVPVQAVRYGVVSLKMLRMVLKSHH